MEADLSFTLLESSNFFNNYINTVNADQQSSSQNININNDNNESFPSLFHQTNRFEFNSTLNLIEPQNEPKTSKTNTKKGKISKDTSKIKQKSSRPETDLNKTDETILKKRVHRYCPPKAKLDYVLECEWNDCTLCFNDIAAFFSHIDQHILTQNQEQTNNSEENFECKWNDCDCTEINGRSTFERHVLFHAFHTKLKNIGQNVLDSYNLKAKPLLSNDAQTSAQSLTSNTLVKCNLDEQTRNSIPELPFEFACSWNACEYDTNNPEAFYKHIRECHVDKMSAAEIKTSNMKCMWSECEQRIANKDRLVEHMRHHSQEKLAACPNCGALFASFTKFIDHCSRSSEAKNLGFQCTHCNKKFATNNLLKEHVRKHINRKKCPLCDMTCIDKNDLSKHILYRHTDLKAHTCPHCSYSSKTDHDLQKHINSIHGDRDDYQCNLCEYKTKSLNTIRRHMIKYHLSKEDSLKYNDGQQFSSSYLCHVCNKVYSSSATLSTHLKSMHHFQLPAGHSRFQYKLDGDGFYRLQTLRYESVELSEEIKKKKACLEIDALSDNPHL